MTEYDYSPEARERYIAKQHAIARWVSNTNRYEPANPFLPSEPSESSHPNQVHHLTERDGQSSNSEDDYYLSSRHHYRRDDRDRHQWSHFDRYDSHQSRSSRQNSRSSSSRPSRHSNSHPHHSSQSSPAHGPAYQYTSRGGQPQNLYYDSIAHDPHGSSSSTPLSSPQPRTAYEQSSNMPTWVPIEGGAGGYVLVPPKGTSYQLVQHQSPPPTQPWFRRVFSPPLNEAAGQKMFRSHSGGGHRRRGSKWSWDIY